MINFTIHPQVLLVIQSTGGGKSAIPQTMAIADGGVTLNEVNQPTPSLC
jgi:superfamily II DNA helicase RecQ